jgi:opacity protein-like surface antigen
VFGDGGGSRGEISGGTVDNSFGVYRAGAGMTVGLTQSLGIGVRYSYFRYRFDMANQVPTVFPGTELSRHAIRVSLDLFAPLYTRARRP